MRTWALGSIFACLTLFSGCPGDDPLVVEGDGARVEIPPGALDEDVEIGVESTDAPVPIPGEYATAGDVFAFTPHGLSFSQPVTIEIPYDTSVAGDLTVLRLDDDDDTTWEEVDAATFSGGTATFHTSTFSYYTPVVSPGGDDDSGDDDSGDDDSGDDDSGQVDADGDGFPEGQDCDDNDPTVYPGADEVCDGVDSDCDGTVDNGCVVDTFVQTGNHQVDLLWVLDNTCSMTDEQSTLAQSFAPLLDALIAAGIDYHVGVVTTDDGTLQGPTPLIDTTTPDPATAFAANVMVGTDGSSSERGLQYGWEALSLALAGTPPNAGFLRDRAGLRMIFISDEDDVSPASVSDYQALYQGVVLRPEYLQCHAICGTDGLSATGCDGPLGYAGPGVRYVQIAQDTGGVLAAICESDWSATMDAISAQADHIADTFVLSQPADPSTIDVFVDGAPLTAPAWSHDAALGAVVFTPTTTPDNGAAVEVRYRP